MQIAGNGYRDTTSLFGGSNRSIHLSGKILQIGNQAWQCLLSAMDTVMKPMRLIRFTGNERFDPLPAPIGIQDSNGHI